MPEKKIILDDYEKEILEAYENGRLKPATSQDDYQAIAANTLKKNFTPACLSATGSPSAGWPCLWFPS